VYFTVVCGYSVMSKSKGSHLDVKLAQREVILKAKDEGESLSM